VDPPAPRRRSTRCCMARSATCAAARIGRGRRGLCCRSAQRPRAAARRVRGLGISAATDRTQRLAPPT
jgi:hypothetical protein